MLSIDYLQNVEGPSVLITTKGQLYKADHVIVTVSIGVLKEKYKSLFIPPLPDYKVNTIKVCFYLIRIREVCMYLKNTNLV